MIYPVVLVVFAVAIVSFLLATVVPKIIEPIIQMGQELPQSTQFCWRLVSSSKSGADYLCRASSLFYGLKLALQNQIFVCLGTENHQLAARR